MFHRSIVHPVISAKRLSAISLCFRQLIPASLVPRKLQHRRIQGGSAAAKKSSGKTIDQPKGDETKQDVERVEVTEENKGSKTNDDFRKMLGLK